MPRNVVLGLSVEEFPPLSDDERTYLLANLRAARMKLKNGKHNQPFFDAAKWVINVHAFHEMLQSEFVPGNEFGARIEDLAKYIERKEREAETEEEPEDDPFVASFPPNL